MLTDEETHDLLHGAAETINVPARTIVPQDRRTWPALVAVAAAVAAVALGVGLAVRPDGSAPPPSDATSTTPVNPDVDLFAGDPKFHLGPDQVPSVAGLSAEAAVRKLEAVGFRVEVRDQSSCWADRALGTEPALGSLVEPGAAVTLLRADGTRRCPAGNSADFELLDFLLGDGQAPRFAAEVTIYRSEDEATVVSADEAADSASWPRREEIARLLESAVYADGEFHPVSIRFGDDPDHFSCGQEEPGGLGGEGSAIMLSPGHLDTIPLVTGECVDLGVYRDDAGAITAVHVDAGIDLDERPPWVFPPNVLGNSKAFALARVDAAGYDAEFIGITDCAPVGIVSQMQGGMDFYPGDTLTFGVTTRTGACAPADWATAATSDSDSDAAAEAFTTFAQGGPQPAWADEVTLSIADITVNTMSRPGDRKEWGYCLVDGVPSPFLQCLSGNVLDLVADQPVTVEDGFPTDRCLFHASQSLNDFATPTVTLRGPGACGFAVSLWTDDEGRIRGVNYLYPRE